MSKKKEHLSYSALGKFEKCPRGYWEEFHGNFSDKTSTKTLLMGQLFHKYIETLGDEAWLRHWIDEHENSRDFFMKSKPTQMYADFIKAMDSAGQFLELGLFEELPNTFISEEENEEILKAAEENNIPLTEEPWHVAQEIRLEGEISKVPFVGVIDMLTIKDGDVFIRDWKYIKDFKRVYNETDRCYEDWYERYIQQQMLYAYLLFNGKCLVDDKDEQQEINFPQLSEKSQIHCEIVGISKGGEITVKRVKFGFKDLNELVNSSTWNIVTSKVRYAWNKLNSVTEKTKKQLDCCGECAWCRANHVVLEEIIQVD